MTSLGPRRSARFQLLAWAGLSLAACSLDLSGLRQRPSASLEPQPEAGSAPVPSIDASASEPPSDSSAPEPAPVDTSSAQPPAVDAGAAELPDAAPAPAPTPDAGGNSECDQSAQRFLSIAQTNCVACHGPRSVGAGGFTSVLDIPALIASGKIVPREPDKSPLFAKVSTGSMPPAARTQRPSPDDVIALRTWITCGAPVDSRPACSADCTKFVDIPTRLSTLVKDLSAFDAETAKDVRYLDLTHYANAGHDARRLELYRDAISYAMNALSSSASVAVPIAVDAQALLFRIRLSAYGWTAESWEQAAAGYPYAVTYDANSREFPIDDTLLQRLRDQTGTQTPVLQADWFFSHAMRPPLYYALLGVPARLAELEAELGIDIADDIASQRVARAGFRESGVSSFNRVIERHALSEERGALWLTYDFEAGSGFSNVLTHPLDFRHTSSQILFGLANGFQAYMIADARGVRLDKAPNAAVRDPDASDFAIESGISCTGCHLTAGVKVQHDEVRAATLLSASNVEESNAILALYKDEPTLEQLFAADNQRYRAALAAARLRVFTDGSAHELDGAYAELLTAKDIAGVLGIEEARLMAAVNVSPGLFPPEALALRIPGNKLARDRFETIFAQLVVALGLGVVQQP